MILDKFAYNKNNITVVILLTIISILGGMYWGSYKTIFHSYGDGMEYMTMIMSFVNHFTPQGEDIDFICSSIAFDNIKYIDNKSGYFVSLYGEMICYHFWLYSLLMTIPYIILKILNFNTAMTFYIGNIFFILCLAMYVLFGTLLKKNMKYIVLLLFIINPVILYIPWSHPECMIYVFSSIGCLLIYEKKYSMGNLFLAIASCQAPILSILVISLSVYTVFKYNDKYNIVLSFIACMISFSPSMYYYYNFAKFSLIQQSFNQSINQISLDKIWSLFFDLNLGMISYVPTIIIIVAVGFLKKNRNCIFWMFITLMLGISTTVQNNWNPGVMYIHRYCIWIMPFALLSVLYCLNSMKNKIRVCGVITHVILTLSLMSYCINNYNLVNHIRFNYISKVIMSVIPSAYNPQEEIFCERAIGKERVFCGEIYIYDNSGELRKYIIKKEGYDNIVYLNGRVKLSNIYDRDINIIINEY